MSDVSKTNEDLLAFIDQTLYANEGGGWFWTNAEVIELLNDIRALAARVPVQGEPNDDRENLITERTYGHGSITLTHYRSSGRIGVVQRGENSVMDVTDLLVFLQDSGLDEDFSRATVPDAATEIAQAKSDLKTVAEVSRATFDKLKAERDAAVAVIERVQAAVSGHPECVRYEDGDVISCGWKSAYASVVAALDGAPEPEVKP